MHHYHYNKSFTLESGAILNELHIAYHTWGKLNENGDNVIWICHALTANSNAAEWWKSLIGDGAAFDTRNYFVVCANIIGSCYGTTGPLSTNPETGHPYLHNFPAITIRDMVQAHEILRESLEIKKIHLLVGGSMGGYQALEWCVMDLTLCRHLFLITASGRETAWGIAIHTTQRMAIELDSTWKEPATTGGAEGLKIARSIGMITYRSYEAFIKTQTDTDADKLDDYKASSYMVHQGTKLVKRFNAHSYWVLTKAMDTHNLARKRESIKKVLKSIKAKTLIIGIDNDLLCPVQEQKFLAEHIPDATFATIHSLYGHDGFLIETDQITNHLSQWFNINS